MSIKYRSKCVASPLKIVAKINSFYKEVMNWMGRLIQKNIVHVIPYLKNGYS